MTDSMLNIRALPCLYETAANINSLRALRALSDGPTNALANSASGATTLQPAGKSYFSNVVLQMNTSEVYIGMQKTSRIVAPARKFRSAQYQISLQHCRRRQKRAAPAAAPTLKATLRHLSALASPRSINRRRHQS